MAKLKEWRPRMRGGQASIRRVGNFLAIVCRSFREANMVQEALIKTLVELRRKTK